MATHDAQSLSMKSQVNTGGTLAADSLDTAALPARGVNVSRPLVAGEIGLTIAERFERARFEVRPIVNGVMEFVVTAESAAARLATAVWAAAATLAKKPALIAAGAAIGIGGVSKGALIPDGASDATYVSYGQDFESKALSFKISVPGVGTGERDTSATYLNSSYAITAAHNVADLLQYNPTYSVSTGSNYVTKIGTTITVDSVMIYPGYSGGFESPDIAILHFAQPLTGGGSENIAPVTVGEMTTEAGFGAHGSPSTGLLPNDHNSRAWNAPVVDGNTGNVSDTYYFSTDFAASDGVSMNGKGLSGDSGGPVFDSLGDLVGIGIGQYGDTDPTGGTVSLDLAQPQVYAWVEANTQTSGVPEPTSSAMLLVSSAALLGRRTRRT